MNHGIVTANSTTSSSQYEPGLPVLIADPCLHASGDEARISLSLSSGGRGGGWLYGEAPP